MAYAALISLEQTIERLLINSSQNPIPPPCCPEIIQLAYEEVKSLQELLSTLEDGNSGRVKAALGREIRETAWRLEDVLESAHVSNQGDEISYNPLTQSQESGKEVITEEINFFTETVKKIKEQLSNSSLRPEELGEVAVKQVFPSRTDHLVGTKSKIIGLDADMIELKDRLTGYLSKLEIIPIVGMAGIGKTTLAKEVYGDPNIVSHFYWRAFVSVGPEYRLREILLHILIQISLATSYKERDRPLAELLYICLKGRRYLIVLDDVWNVPVWDELRRCFPDDENGSRIVLTTRMEEVAYYASPWYPLHKMRFLTDEDSWHLLCEKVFGEEHSCPPQLEKAGKKIAKNCEGLPLAIIVIGKHLSKAERTPEYWSKVAEKECSNIIAADEEMSKVLYLSYKYLPLHLKACFLYMGVFPHDYEIPPSKLIKLWCAEGFLGRNSIKTVEDLAMEYLGALVSKSVVLVHQQSSSGRIKTCRLHSVFWHLCIREAVKDKFFHVLDSYANQGIESQRRLCIHNNVLFGISDVYQLMTSISNVRSLLCTGPHHEYPLPICLGSFSLLRVLDALTIRFYGFPTEVVKLIQLRYIAFTYNGKLPASISKLQNLQSLIVRQYLRIIPSSTRRVYLPMEIWTMQELRHLQVMGSDLPDPSSEDALLPNLLSLLDVSARSCTNEVLGRIPNLKKLGIRIELPLDATEPLCCFNRLASLHQLESLKCSIVNPSPRLQVLGPRPLVSVLPPALTKLTLRGLGYPWEYMSSIACLPNLKVLKLRCYAFRGSKWEIFEEGFGQLRFLLIEDIDLEYWGVDWTHFPRLELLTIRHCYKLKEIPLDIGEIPTLEMIELVDCDPSLVASAQQILEEQQSLGNDSIQICVKSAEDDQKPKFMGSTLAQKW